MTLRDSSPCFGRFQKVCSLERFARVILGYHGAKPGEAAEFSKKLLLGEVKIDEWRPSENEFDWLGHGIYFWEHSPERAQRWAGEGGVVIGAVIQLGRCLDLTDLACTRALKKSFESLEKSFAEKNMDLPKNTGKELKNRKLDCLVINTLVTLQGETEPRVQTVRGAFEEGDEAFPGSMLKMETHIQVAVRDVGCILGVFRPEF
jgi:hypothetical protein